ncbi:MAG: DUF1508 domain-containing protein [Myxococcaceae bacterium]|nr:DUF1508 domain-containing protein [Myxococcaceae bacterium]
MNFLRLTLSVLVVAALSACGVETDADGVGADDVLSQEEAALAAQARFQTYVDSRGQHRFQLVAGNGQKVLGSEGYVSEAGMKNGIASVKKNGSNESRYQVRETSDGAWYFVLTAANHKVIGVSGYYVSQANAVRGINTVRGLVKVAIIDEPAAGGAPKFEVFKGVDARYYFNLKAANGQVMLQSQAYTSKASANNGVSSVQTNGANVFRYQVLEAADGRVYFVLRAANGEVIARSALFETSTDAGEAIADLVEILSGQIAR